MNKNVSLMHFAKHWLHGPLPADLMAHLVDVMNEPGYEDTPEKTVHHIVWQAIKYGLEHTPVAEPESAQKATVSDDLLNAN